MSTHRLNMGTLILSLGVSWAKQPLTFPPMWISDTQKTDYSCAVHAGGGTWPQELRLSASGLPPRPGVSAGRNMEGQWVPAVCCSSEVPEAVRVTETKGRSPGSCPGSWLSGPTHLPGHWQVFCCAVGERRLFLCVFFVLFFCTVVSPCN